VTAGTVKPGLCEVPPASRGSQEWLASRLHVLEAYQAQYAKARAIDAGEREPFGPEAARLHGLKEGEKYPAAWREDPEQRVDAWLWAHADEVELRALGYCRSCGSPTKLQQVGRCVYTTCGHYRAQGELARMQSYLDLLRPNISAERRAALLALIGQR